MSIIITGSDGFIGSHLTKHFEAKDIEVIPWDIKNGGTQDIHNLFIPPDVTFVIHLAAIADVRRSIREPDIYWEQNVLGTKHVQEKCAQKDIPLLYASSSCVHAWGKSPYGMSKKVNELTAQPEQIGMRFTTVYGDGARDSMFIGKLQRGEIEYVTTHIRDFIHVSDVIQAIELLMDNYATLEDYSYNIGTGVGNEVRKLGELNNFYGPVKSGHECEALDNTADNSAIRKLGWKQTVFVDEYINKGFTL